MVPALRTLLSGFLLAVCLCAGDLRSPSPLGIFLDFDSAPAGDALETMKREVAELLRPAGLMPAFFVNRRVHRDRAGAAVVIRFKGKCALDRWASDDFSPMQRPTALAATRVERGKVMPFSEVRCDQLRRAVDAVDPRAGRKQQQAALGVAMGRVVAHELYHVLARTTHHAAEGLAKATHDLKDLVTGTLGFAEEDARAMQGQESGAGCRSCPTRSPRTTASSQD